MNREQTILNYLRQHEEEIFSDLEELVRAESPSRDLSRLAACREVLAGITERRTGIRPTVLNPAADHPMLGFSYGDGAQTVVLIGHYDTVHPVGLFPFRIEGNEMHGPGIQDMKAGLISILWTIRAYQELKIDPGYCLEIRMNGDEEIGSPDSTELLHEAAKKSRAVLVLEPCNSNGTLKTGRKGSMRFRVKVEGKAAHSGNEHRNGISAIEEMAHEILAIQRLTDYEKGTLLNVGICSGGTKHNVIPAEAEYIVDCRFGMLSECERVRDFILELPVTVPGSRRHPEILRWKPPMEENEKNMALYSVAEQCANRLGIGLGHSVAGGGSDGNAISAMGIPVLDGLGAVGAGLHGVKEHILRDQYIPRIALLASLIPEI